MLLVDTGPLLAAADRDDAHHLACRDLLEADPGPLVTSPLVIAEAAYLIDRQLGPGAEAALFASVVAGDLVVEDLGRADWERMAERVRTYADMRLGGTDACAWGAPTPRWWPWPSASALPGWPRSTTATSGWSALVTWTPSSCSPEKWGLGKGPSSPAALSARPLPDGHHASDVQRTFRDRGRPVLLCISPSSSSATPELSVFTSLKGASAGGAWSTAEKASPDGGVPDRQVDVVQ